MNPGASALRLVTWTDTLLIYTRGGILLDNLDSNLSTQYNGHIWESLNKLNSSRAKNTSIITFILVLSTMILDFFNFKRGLLQINHGYVLLFYTHVIMFVVFLLLIMIYYINKRHSHFSFHKYYAMIFSFFILNITSYMSGWVDQLIHGQITAYCIGCFVVGIFFHFKPKYIVLLYSQSYFVFIIYLNMTQKNNDILQANCINSSIFITLTCFISITITKLMQREYIYKYKLEELVKTRSNALAIQQHAINRLQQLNLVGEMSTIIARDVSHPITTVKNYLQLLGSREYNGKDKPYFDLMTEELDRANRILSNFQLFSKEKNYLLTKQNLNTIISKLIPLLDIDIKYNFATDLGEIPDLLLEEHQICQLLLNFVNNGYESMPSGGRLLIKTYQFNKKVILEVCDQGEGIDPDILEKISTPFFTTKKQGAGLGLGVCRNIIDQHNARLQIVSNSNGSIFRVIFNRYSTSPTIMNKNRNNYEPRTEEDKTSSPPSGLLAIKPV